METIIPLAIGWFIGTVIGTVITLPFHLFLLIDSELWQQYFEREMNETGDCPTNIGTGFKLWKKYRKDTK